MCSPHVQHVIQERIAREGAPKVSRRNLLKLGGAAAAGIALTASGLAVPTRARARHAAEMLDLSHVFSPSVPTYAGTPGASRVDQVTIAVDGFYIQSWTFDEHTGTHMDIPAHFIADGETVDNYSVSLFLSRAVVIDISAKAEENPDATLDLEDIEAWEAENGEIPEGAMVCMYSGWESRWEDVDAFRNVGDDGAMHFPGFGGEAAAFLIAERDIHGIAVDTLSLDNGPSTTFDVHFTILGAGKYGLENVANLSSLIGTTADIIVGVPRWEAGSGGPCRVMAMI
jgi:kynurenine formamidase